MRSSGDLRTPSDRDRAGVVVGDAPTMWKTCGTLRSADFRTSFRSAASSRSSAPAWMILCVAAGGFPSCCSSIRRFRSPHRRGRGGEFGREVHDRRVERALHRDANRDRGRVPGAAHRGRRSRGGHYREVARERGRPRTSIAPSAAPRRARCDGICDVTLANKKAVTRQRQISTAADEAAVHTRVARRTRRCARCARSRALARGASTSAARSSRRPARPRRPRRRSTPRHRLGRRRRGDGRRRRRHRGGCPRASPASAPR